jgi:hypothetical protein
MTRNKLVILMLLIVVAIASASDAQQARPLSEQFRLASVMPSRAMLYVQAGDLSGLMKRWLASPIRKGYYDSDSFRSFSRSHAYLKLQDRRKDFETALGFGLDEQRLSELSGGASAVALYDIGKLELVFVTEIPRTRAIASAMFKQQPQFQERSAAGTSYFVRDVATDGGRLNQQFCFAYADGKLLVATAEGLIVRALANLKSQTDDSMAPVIVKSAEGADGFSSHDVTMWLDQVRLNESRHFRNYWIHRNVDDLAAIESGLIDLTISGTAINERRWFKIKAGAEAITPGRDLTRQEIADLAKFAPADAQLVEISRGAVSLDHLTSNVADVLFGELQVAQTEARYSGGWSPSEPSDGSDQDRTQRYGHLDNRFDMDVDDPDAPGRGAKQVGVQEPADSSNQFEKHLATVLQTAEPSGYCVLGRSRAETGKPFVRFDRALVVALKPQAQIDRSALENAIAGEFRSRFVVAGSGDQFGWQEAGGARFIAQSLMERGAAYAVSGRYLVFASSSEFATDVLRAAGSAAATGPAVPVALTAYALLRVANARPMYDTLMSSLDRPASVSLEQDDRHISFFSQNVGSLVGALSFRQIEFSQENGATLLRENLTYSW